MIHLTTLETDHCRTGIMKGADSTAPEPEDGTRGVLNWQATSHLDAVGQSTSNLRVYCDSTEHWELNADDSDDDVPNSQRPPNEQDFLDMTNYLLAKGLACATNKAMETTERNAIDVGDEQEMARVRTDVSCAPVPQSWHAC